MRASIQFLGSLAIALTFAGCATSGAKLADQKDLSISWLDTATTKKQFRVNDAPNPFTSLVMHISTAPMNIHAAAVTLPGGDVRKIEIEDVAVYNVDGELITEAAKSQDMLAYWKTMGFSSDIQRRLFDAINRYYLPGPVITGKKLGQTYAVAFITKEPIKATDRLIATIKVDDIEKSFDIDASSIIQEKAKKAPKSKATEN